MIDDKYIELMNLEIDGIITVLESEDLYDYLKQNKEADNYFIDLKKSVELLEQIPDQAPPQNLKKNILNSIDENKYLSSKPVKKRKNFSPIQYFLKPHFAFTLAVGIFIGIIFYPFFFYVQKNNIKDNDVTGTMGLTENTLKITNISINKNLVSGNILLNKTGNKYWFEVNIKVKNHYSLIIDYNSSKLFFDYLSIFEKTKVSINKNNSKILITGNDNSHFKLYFNKIKSIPFDFQINLSMQGKKQISKQIKVE